jgi:hypothetical protein
VWLGRFVTYPLKSAEFMACVDAWLHHARQGHCAAADGPGDCSTGDKGSWPLEDRGVLVSWQAAATYCVGKCRACQRCSHLSISLKWKDCTWSHGPCELMTHMPEFRTAPVCPRAHNGSHASGINSRGDDGGNSFGDDGYIEIEERADDGMGAERTHALEAPTTTPLWLAVGVIVAPGVQVQDAALDTPLRGLRFMHQSFASRLNGTVAWQWVTTEEDRRRDPRFTFVPCRDGGEKASACACKTIHWFRRALHLFPNARFIAKMEDDSALHDARILAELRLAWMRHGPSAHLWYGLFQWAGTDPSSRLSGWFCGEGDKLLHTKRPMCEPPPLRTRTERPSADMTVRAWSPPPPSPPPRWPSQHRAKHASSRSGAYDAEFWGSDSETASAVAPFASGGLDVRSRALAAFIADGGYDARWAHEWTALGGHNGCKKSQSVCEPGDWAVACDAILGYLLARTLRSSGPPWPNVTLLHLTTRKFQYGGDPPAVSTSVMHGYELKQAARWRELPRDWRFHAGPAMQPIEMRLTPTTHGSLGWEPLSRPDVDAFLKLKKRRCSQRSDADLSASGADKDGRLPCIPVPTDAELHLPSRQRQRRRTQ